MKFVDTHTHPYDEAFDADREEVLQRALDAGVEKWIFPSIDSTYYRRQKECFDKHQCNAFMAMGLHPTSVAANWKEELNFVFEQMKQSANFSHDSATTSSVRYYAVGEIGLDGYWSKEFIAEQMEVFSAQIDMAEQYSLPIIIHERSATDEMFRVLENHVFGKDSNTHKIKGVFHAFSGSPETFERIQKYGDFKVGIGGVVTYKNAGVAKALENIPLESIVLETDSPWLTPVPFRGKRNESSYIPYIAAKVSEIKHCSVEDVAAQTTKNAEELFGI
ncbi:MAG: TatD family hydrolase [Bacteroidales bacterium]|jgi:TatD DNase family protein|nr:TatD family hydrolase [Bacteroidales bacterium]MCI1733775.1 TatD family hydrolase [Bacteroidales bacterium]